MHSTQLPANRKPILTWLTACLLMVALMVVVGGLTRLTESGLSMVEWKPTTLLPPMNEEQWQEEFTKYRESPQYQKVNHGMSADEFQGIFWLEYIHRLLGRLVGLVFFLPFAIFWFRKMLPPPLALRLGGIFLLGGLQGVIGWYMVKSGLVDQPWVSPVRLAMHLGLAVIIFGLILWQILSLQPSFLRKQESSRAISAKPLWMPAFAGMTALWWLALGVLYIQILLGALVAGLDAGMLFNTFPDMNGNWVPAGIWHLQPWYLNLAENATTVHFLHRLGALVATLAILAVALPARAWTVLAALALQIGLGALTVIHSVPIVMASLHQAVALLLFALVLQACFKTR